MKNCCYNNICNKNYVKKFFLIRCPDCGSYITLLTYLYRILPF